MVVRWIVETIRFKDIKKGTGWESPTVPAAVSSAYDDVCSRHKFSRLHCVTDLMVGKAQAIGTSQKTCHFASAEYAPGDG